jgi:hypothetical protein
VTSFSVMLMGSRGFTELRLCLSSWCFVRRLAGVAVDMNSNHHHARHHCLTSTDHITNN